MNSLTKEITDVLEATGLPWTAETGGKHIKLRLAGHLVGILPRGKISTHARRAVLNTISQIKRAARQIRETGRT